MKKILLIEDDQSLVRVIGDRLAANSYNFSYTTNGFDGLKLLLNESFDLLLLDIMLPGVSGFDIVRELRSKGQIIPIIIMSARFQLSDKIKGLKLGADDYLVKPFDFDELLARIEAHIRRDSIVLNQDTDFIGNSLVDHNSISFDEFCINFQLCQVTKENKVVAMSKMEFKLLAYLILNSDRVIKAEELFEKVWDYEESISIRTLYVHIAWLRKKIQSNKKSSNYIKTVRGIGYRFDYLLE